MQYFQELSEKTTHLVAIQPGTVKVRDAKKQGKVKIVNPDWLWTCAERWEHVDERLYPLREVPLHKVRISNVIINQFFLHYESNFFLFQFANPMNYCLVSIIIWYLSLLFTNLCEHLSKITE